MPGVLQYEPGFGADIDLVHLRFHTRPLLVQDWYCFRSYQTGFFFYTSTHTSTIYPGCTLYTGTTLVHTLVGDCPSNKRCTSFCRYPLCWKPDLDTPCKRAGNANILQTGPILSKRFKKKFVMVQSNWLLAYLSMKQGSLLCFVCHNKISQTTALHVMLLVSSAPHE